MIFGVNGSLGDDAHHKEMMHAAYIMHGDLLYEESHNVIVYKCWHCGERHRAIKDGSVVRKLADPQPGIPREEMAVGAPPIPEVFHEAIHKAFEEA